MGQKEFEAKAYGFLERTEYRIIGKYATNNSPVEIEHIGCGKFKMRPTNIYKGQKCPICRYLRMKNGMLSNTEEFQRKLDKVYGEGFYEVVGQYTKSTEHVDIRHCMCGTVSSYIPRHILDKDSSCPSCNENRVLPRQSIGVQQIRAELDRRKIRYETEVSFDECRRVRPLKFDFCVYLTQTEDDYILIEYDGLQHFRSSGSIRASTVEVNKERDAIKDRFCHEYGIPFYRISYMDDVMDSLNTILAKHM